MRGSNYIIGLVVAVAVAVAVAAALHVQTPQSSTPVVCTHGNLSNRDLLPAKDHGPGVCVDCCGEN